MFLNAKSFDSNISKWRSSKITLLADMFLNAASFNQNLCSWNKQFSNKNNRYLFSKFYNVV